MKRFVFLILGGLAVGACSRGDNPDDLFNSSNGGIDPSAGAAGLSGMNSGSIDQNSLQYFSQVIGDRVLFTVDQSNLTPQATAILDQQVAWLAPRSGLSITIEGHADEQGTRDYNLRLSQRRAAVVRDYMVAKGLPDSRLSILPFGKERPVAVCSNESCWSQNRRAVTVVTGGLGS